MSEFLAEAQVLITPDTTKFRVLLAAELATITKGIPPVVIPVVAGAASTATAAVQKAADTVTRKSVGSKAAAARATTLLAKAEEQLAGVEKAALLGTSQLSAARIRLSGTSTAVATAVRALAAAEKSKNAALIESVEATLAQAQADEIRARAAARTILLANAQTAALEREAASATKVAKSQVVSAQVQGAASREAAASARNLARAQGLAGVAGNKLAVSQGTVANAASAVGAAQITATRSTAAVTAAQRALDVALRSQDAALITTARNTLTLAEAQAASASAALAAARAHAAQAGSLGGISKGAGSAAASLFGVRGATLAASGSFLAGAAAVVLFSRAVQAAAALEQNLNVFRITARATADEMERVSEEARALGKDITLPGVSSADAAESMTELAKAGLSVRDSLSGARGTLQLAAAAQISNAEASELAANALNAFGLSGVEAVHVADLLASSANLAQGSIADMGLALRQSAAVARQAGISIEDTSAILTLLARNGLRGSDAGTAFRTALIRLINPTAKARTELERLDVKIRDVNGNIRPQVFADLATATEDWSRAQQDASAALIFGQDAIRLQAILGREGAAALDDMTAAQTRQGAAAELAGARAQGFSGAMSALTSNLETLGTTLGTITLPALTGFVKGLNNIVTAASNVASGGLSLAHLVGDLNAELVESIPLLQRFEERAKGAFGSSFADALLPGGAQAIRKINEVADSIEKARNVVETDAEAITRGLDKVFASIVGPTGPTALNQAVLTLQDMADKLSAGDVEARKVGRELRAIIQEIQKIGGLPASVINIMARLDKAGLDREANEGGRVILEALTSVLSPAAGRGLGFEFFNTIGDGMKDAAPLVAREAGGILIQSLETQLSVAEATGAGDREILGILRERQAKQQAALDRQLALPQGRNRQAAVQRAANALTETNNQIESILDKQAADAKEFSARAITAQSEADQAIIDSIGKEEGRLQNAQTIAAASEGKQDDIRANTALRNFYKSAIAEAKATIKDAKTRANVVAALIADQIRASISLRAAQRALNEEIRQEARDARAAAAERTANLIERAQLDVAFAETIGNVDREIRARRSLIAQYKKAQAAAKGNINEVKRYRNLIAAETAAIKELQGAKKEQGTTLGELTFDFFTKQQGFAANLLGNLIPGDATAGLVGGSQTTTSSIPDPSAGLQAQAAAKSGGPTFGQAATEVDVLKQVLQVLREIRGGRSHPEANYQRFTQHSNMDGVGGV